MALAFDAKSGQDDDTGTSSTVTASHTCTGKDLILFSGVLTNNSVAATGCTYNGVAMTRIADLNADTTVVLSLFYLIAPATGTHNVVATASGNTIIRVRNSSYTGAQQSGQPDAHVTQGATGSPDTTTLTTVAANCWTVLFARGTTSPITASTGSTERSSGAAGDTKYFDSNGALSSGSNSMTITLSGNAYTIMASFAPTQSGGSFLLNFV